MPDALDLRCLECQGMYHPPEAPVRVTLEEMLSFSASEIAAFQAPDPNPIPSTPGATWDS
jgi:hypothetical protein